MSPRPPAPVRPGFALVLALAIMALLVLVTLSLAGLLRVESSVALGRQAGVVARLNALAAVRLAQSAVQQALGPDTRVSASATLFDDPAASSLTTPGKDAYEYPVLGAWRSWEGHDHDRRKNSRFAGRPQAPDYASKTKSYLAVDATGDPLGGDAAPAVPVGFLRIAAQLRVTDQFNVNSVSVPAWRAILGSLRAREVPVLVPGATTVIRVAVADAPLPRMQVAAENATASGNPSRAVLGFASLTDDQLDRLATEIVAQVRLRGPFLSLSEFVNRRLVAADGETTDPSLSGAVGMALRQLEADLAKPAADFGKTTSTKAAFNGTGLLGAGPDGRPLLALGDFTDATGDYAHPKAAEGNSNFGLPGWPRQADVLRPLAPIITVRDDTVVVRAYGAASVAGGGASSAWCEVVLVRTPEYVDARVAAHEAPLGDGITTGTVGLANLNLGRRYRVVAFRWLRPQEI